MKNNLHHLKDLLVSQNAGEWGSDPIGADALSILRAGNIADEGWIDLEDVVCRTIAEPKRSKILLKSGDILLEKSGGTDTRPVGRVAYIETNLNAGFSNFLHRLRPNPLIIQPRYLFFVLMYWHSSGRAVALQTRTTGIRNLMFARYMSEPIRVPLMVQQICVSRILELSTTSLSKIDRLIAAKREQKRGLMQQLLTGKLRFPGFTEPWAALTIKSLLASDCSGAWGEEPNESNSGTVILRSTNITNDGRIDLQSTVYRILDHKKRNDLLIHAGDILLERSGGTDTRPVGRVAFARMDLGACFSNFLQRLRPNEEVVDPRFLFWQLFKLHAIGATNRLQAQTTGIRNLMFRAYLEQPVLIPERREQTRICDLIQLVSNEIELLEQQRAAFAAQRRGLMEKLLSGEIDIQNPKETAA